MNGNSCAPLHSSLYLKLSSFVLIRLFMFLFHFVEEIENWPTKVERIFEHTSASSTYMLLTLGSLYLSFALNVIWYFARVPSNTLGHLLYCLRFEIKYKMHTLFEEGNGNKNESQNEKKKERNLLTILHRPLLLLGHLAKFFFWRIFPGAFLALVLLSLCRECKTEDK